MSNATHLLPPNSTALERAIATANAAIDDIPVPLRELWNPDTCPVALLPWLAWTFAVDQWDSNWSETQKRATIKSAVEVHRHRGTVGSVRQALNALGYDITLQEWFAQEPLGDAYTFDLLLDSNQVGVDDAALTEIMRRVNLYKNLRSHLRRVKPTVTTRNQLMLGGATLTGSTVTVAYGAPRYSDGSPAFDLMIDAAVNGEASTVSALDTLDNVLRVKMPANSWKNSR